MRIEYFILDFSFSKLTKPYIELVQYIIYTLPLIVHH